MPRPYSFPHTDPCHHDGDSSFIFDGCGDGDSDGCASPRSAPTTTSAFSRQPATVSPRCHRSRPLTTATATGVSSSSAAFHGECFVVGDNIDTYHIIPAEHVTLCHPSPTSNASSAPSTSWASPLRPTRFCLWPPARSRPATPSSSVAPSSGAGSMKARYCQAGPPGCCCGRGLHPHLLPQFRGHRGGVSPGASP
ncbi:hypothetical protein ZWY2020_007674 [Hordeum vulgare]|nr:hypothetical protein ZWY2020_007674 [Hordeum vulgare]